MTKLDQTGGTALVHTPGFVPLSEAIEALRAELHKVWWDSRNQELHFRVAPVEVTLQVTASNAGEGGVGVNWYLFDANAKVQHETQVVQTIKLSLSPVTFDAHGVQREILVDGPQHQRSTGPIEAPLDGPG